MKIGFIDLYLDEWHANNYPVWIKELTDKHSVAYAWGETDAKNGKTNREWCDAFGVTLCASMEEVCEKSDAILVLAPSDPQVHLGYARVVLPYGKPTYIDKTFAPDLATAKEIFAIAKAHNTPLFTTSALRYATETEGDFTEALVTGGGRSAEEYIIHQVEMTEVMLGRGATSVTALPAANGTLFRIAYPDTRKAALLYGEGLPFTRHCTTAEGKHSYRAVTSPFFQTLIGKILTFFETGIPPVQEESTLEVMAIREGVIRALAAPGTEILL